MNRHKHGGAWESNRMSPAPYLCRKILKGPRRMDIPVRLGRPMLGVVSRSKSRGAGQIFIFTDRKLPAFLPTHALNPKGPILVDQANSSAKLRNLQLRNG